MKRSPMNQKNSAQKFNKSAQKTKAANAAPPPMRGGYRL